MAGRSKDKLQETKIALAEDGCLGADGIPEILADSFDRASLDAMTIQTKTVITTVG